MRLLALDTGTKTGWATNSDLEGIISGVQDFTLKRGESPGMRFLMFQKWITDMLHNIRPGMVIYERAHHRGGAATEVGVGLTTHLQSACASAGVEFVAIHSGTLKKHATGKGNANKQSMMAAARSKGWNFEDDNESDALWLLDYAIENYGD